MPNRMARAAGVLALVAAAGAEVCFLQYKDAACEGAGILQGLLDGDSVYGDKPQGCNAGQFGAVIDRCTQPDCNSHYKDKCDVDNCLIDSNCQEYTAFCASKVLGDDAPLCLRNMTYYAAKVHRKSLQQAKTVCAEYATHGGWRWPVSTFVANLAGNLTQAMAKADAVIPRPATLRYMIDATYNATAKKWQDSNLQTIDFTGFWVPGTDPSNPGHTQATLVRHPGVNDSLYIAAIDPAAAPTSVLCDVANITASVPTPVPTTRPPLGPGECGLGLRRRGIVLKECKAKACASVTGKDEEVAMQKCCSLGGHVCTGVYRLQGSELWRAGAGNATDPPIDTEGVTFVRPQISYESPQTFEGLSPVLIGCLCFLVFVSFYCAIGMAFNVQRGETSCPEVLPNHVIWAALPAVFGQCCSGLCDTIRNTRAGYSTRMDVDELDMVDNDPIPSENC